MRNNTVALVAAAVIATCLLQKTVRADDAAVTLTRPLKVGDVVRHKLTSDVLIAALGSPLKLEEVAKAQIKEIKPDGSAVVEETIESGHISGSGVDQDTPSGITRTEVRDRYGKLLESKQDDTPSPIAPEYQRVVASVSDVILPDKPVKPGDTWETQFEVPASKSAKYTVKDTYVGTQSVEGKDLWKVKQATEVPTSDDGKQKMTFEMTALLDPKTGQIVSADITVKGIPVSAPGPTTMDMSGQLTQLKADAPAKTEK